MRDFHERESPSVSSVLNTDFLPYCILLLHIPAYIAYNYHFLSKILAYLKKKQ